jgi:hypothetical protein
MSHATTFGSIVGAARLIGLKPRSPQRDYDRVLEAAQNPRDRATRPAREARYAEMRAKGTNR